MVAALILDDGDRAAIHRALGRRMSVRVCERADVLRSMLAATDVRLVVAELRDRVGTSVLPALVDAAARAESPALVARVSLADAADDVMQLAGARVPARVSLREVSPIGDALTLALGGVHAPRADLVILERIGPLVPRALRAFLVLCAVAPSPRLHVGRAAMLLGVTPRTIEIRLAQAALPPAYRIIGWCVALHAAWQLDVLGQRPKQVAANLGFKSVAAAANLLARYCKASPTSLRIHGGFQVQLERFAALVQRNLRTE
jgi:hypothetical protein